MMNERKYKDVPTTELLDFISQEISYDNTEEIQKKHDYEDELEERRPFNQMQRKLNNMQQEINELNKIVDKLLTHQHGRDDRPTINLREIFGKRVY